MPDREKVIKGLAHCTRPTEYGKGGNHCMDCPYTEAIGFNQFKCNGQQMMKDALALLKEQEAVKPILIREGRNKHYNDYVCPRCDNDVIYEQNYCSECGVRFLWEGR